MRGLFDRLACGGREFDELASIAAHLHALLNTVHGGHAVEPMLGRPDLTDLVHSYPEGVRAAERAMRAMIERFEPRLVEVDVRAARDPGALRLSFVVQARRASDHSRPLRIVTDLDARGRFTVRP